MSDEEEDICPTSVNHTPPLLVSLLAKWSGRQTIFRALESTPCVPHTHTTLYTKYWTHALPERFHLSYSCLLNSVLKHYLSQCRRLICDPPKERVAPPFFPLAKARTSQASFSWRGPIVEAFLSTGSLFLNRKPFSHRLTLAIQRWSLTPEQV